MLRVWFARVVVRCRILRLGLNPDAPSALFLDVGLRGTVVDAEPSLSRCHYVVFRDARASRAKPKTNKQNRRDARASRAKPTTQQQTTDATRARRETKKTLALCLGIPDIRRNHIYIYIYIYIYMYHHQILQVSEIK